METDDFGTAIAMHYRDGSSWEFEWNPSGLTRFAPASARPAEGLWIAPGLFDLQVNGYAGTDFQRECTFEALWEVAIALRRDGCHRSLITLITCPWEELLRKIKRLRRIIRGESGLHRAFPGWHIEGPFLSDQPGFHGAHNPKWMRDPSPECIWQLKEIVEDDPVLLTFAPERSGSIEAIAEAIRCGFTVSFGHTNATAPQLRAAIAAGGKAFTHLGNGCPQKLDRHDNIIWRSIDEEVLVAGIIPDGHHVSPSFFRTLHRALGPNRVYWTTDAMAGAGAPNGQYSLGEIEVSVGEDRVARNPATGTFAGSTLAPVEGIRRGADMLGLPWQKVWDFFSLQPAVLLNLTCELAVGAPAGFCLIRED